MLTYCCQRDDVTSFQSRLRSLYNLWLRSLYYPIMATGTPPMCPPMQISRAIDNAAAGLGYHSIKQEQRAAIQAFVAGEDVFVSPPTGYGKSLC